MPCSWFVDGFLEDERRFDEAVAVAEVEAVGVGAFDLGADANGWDGERARPVFDGFAEAFADAGAAGGVVDDESADVDGIGVLEMALDGGVDPADEAAVENRGKNDVVRCRDERFDARPEVGR